MKRLHEYTKIDKNEVFTEYAGREDRNRPRETDHITENQTEYSRGTTSRNYQSPIKHSTQSATFREYLLCSHFNCRFIIEQGCLSDALE